MTAYVEIEPSDAARRLRPLKNYLKVSYTDLPRVELPVVKVLHGVARVATAANQLGMQTNNLFRS
jgi:hypothetical protein